VSLSNWFWKLRRELPPLSSGFKAEAVVSLATLGITYLTTECCIPADLSSKYGAF